MRILVTGGVRSGKSRHAEGLLSPADPVRYVAPGPQRDDEDWQARLDAHRRRRPAAWSTLETGDLPAALATSDPVLVDCLGTWVTRLVDDAELWEAPADVVGTHVLDAVERAVAALTGDVVLVTNEVGLGVVPAHRSGRLFRDLLGSVNHRFAEAVDEVHLVVAGRVLRL